MARVGFVVNPIAGMGGAVGLKGTDGTSITQAEARGAIPAAPRRAEQVLRHLTRRHEVLTAGGLMGEEGLRAAGFETYRVVHQPPPKTSRADTMVACRQFLENHVDLVLFCGGDGTARDVLEVVDQKVPILGIPAGVKMHSAVFAASPEAAAAAVERFLAGEITVQEAEVMDVDEEAYRADEWAVKVYGYALVPKEPALIAAGKTLVEGPAEDDVHKAIAEYVAELIDADTLAILGPGTSTREIARCWGAEKTLLGVDAYLGGRMVARDASERDLLDRLALHPKARIVVSPIGAQGFVLGRGNQPISPAVIRRVGAEHVLVAATPAKLQTTPSLRVDTGDAEVDGQLRGWRRVITGYHEMAMRVVS